MFLKNDLSAFSQRSCIFAFLGPRQPDNSVDFELASSAEAARNHV